MISINNEIKSLYIQMNEEDHSALKVYCATNKISIKDWLHQKIKEDIKGQFKTVNIDKFKEKTQELQKIINEICNLY